MRPIDADALIEFCAERWIPLNIDAVNMQPTVQPEERTEKRMETHACDLISRRAAIDGKISIQLANGVEIYSDEAVPVEYLKNLPTIQPEPKEGHWIWVAGDLECSKCHTRYPDLYPDYDNSVACPHCGCKMEVEHDSDLHAE